MVQRMAVRISLERILAEGESCVDDLGKLIEILGAEELALWDLILKLMKPKDGLGRRTSIRYCYQGV